MAYLNDAQFKERRLGFNIGIDATAVMMPDDPQIRAAALATVKGSLKAWDPVTQTVKWSVEHPAAWNGGVLSTAGNLVFCGQSGLPRQRRRRLRRLQRGRWHEAVVVPGADGCRRRASDLRDRR